MFSCQSPKSKLGNSVSKRSQVRSTLMIMSGFDLPEEQGGAPTELKRKYRELLTRAVAEGHELGNHLQFEAGKAKAGKRCEK